MNKMSSCGRFGFAVPAHLAVPHVAEVLAVWHAVAYRQWLGFRIPRLVEAHPRWLQSLGMV